MFAYISEPDWLNAIFFLAYNNEEDVKECTHVF